MLKNKLLIKLIAITMLILILLVNFSIAVDENTIKENMITENKIENTTNATIENKTKGENTVVQTNTEVQKETETNNKKIEDEVKENSKTQNEVKTQLKAEDTNTVETEKEMKITYNTHIQDIGWEKDFSKSNGQMSGTQGKAKRLEGIKIKGENLPVGAKIQYQVHVQNVGWQEWKKDGDMAGTEGRSLRLEGIKIRLVNMPEYSVQYRVHVQNIGWQSWREDGALGGTTGKSLRLEAIEIKIVKKQIKGAITVETNINNKVFMEPIAILGWKMSNVSDTKIKVFVDDTDITTKSNLQYKNRTDLSEKILYGGDTENAKPGFSLSVAIADLTAGTHKITLKLVTADETTILSTYNANVNIDKSIHVKYKSHVQDIGWQSDVADGATSGTSGKSKRVEAMTIKAYNLPAGVNLKVQAHVQDIGWQAWVSNGGTIGTSGRSLRMEAVKLKLENTDKYSVMYRAHVQDIGWQDWAYDGETAGTIGEAKRIEAIQIKVVDKITEQKTKVYLDTSGNITNEKHTVTGWCMTNVKNTNIQILIDDTKVSGTINRVADQSVLNRIKGYGGEELNPKPRFSLSVDFSKYSLGKHTIKVQVLSSDDEILKEISTTVNCVKKIEMSTGTYGKSGLKVKGDSRGTDLKYYKYGSGPNVFFATFCVHGFEDKWNQDGTELVLIANSFWERLKASNDANLASKWTIYIFPEVNPDGRVYGTTNNGPGRTTLYSAAPGNKGIDLNRCWSAGFSASYNGRNYTGAQPFLAYEAVYLRDFLLSHKSQNGQTLLVDLHGWTQQLIGDETIRSYYKQQFPENVDTPSYGRGYLINWARTNLGSSGKAAKSALIELPSYINGPQDVKNHNLTNRYINATLTMLNGIN